MDWSADCSSAARIWAAPGAPPGVPRATVVDADWPADSSFGRSPIAHPASNTERARAASRRLGTSRHANGVGLLNRGHPPPDAVASAPVIRLDAATVLLQWATGGLVFL